MHRGSVGSKIYLHFEFIERLANIKFTLLSTYHGNADYTFEGLKAKHGTCIWKWVKTIGLKFIHGPKHTKVL